MKKVLVVFLQFLAVNSVLAQVRVTQVATNHASGAPLVGVFPAPPATNDVLIALIGYYTPDTLAAPSGWTLLRQQFGNGPGGTTGFTSFYHVVVAGEANHYTFTGVSNNATVTVYDVAGADMYHPINTLASAANTTTIGSVTTPTVTPTVAGTLVLAAIASEATHATGITVAGWTYTPAVSTAHGVAAGFGPVQPGLTPVSATFSLTGSDNYGIAAVTILLSPAGTTGHTPTAAPGGPYSGVTGMAVNFDASASSGPRNEPLTYTWSFGDGSSGTGSMPSHVYSTAGSFTVSLSVTNTDGYTATATTGISIGQDCSSVSTGNFGALNGFVPSPKDAWHLDVTNFPVDPMSNTILVTNTNDLAGSHLHPDFGGNGAYGIPYTVVDSATAPVPLTVWEYPSESDTTLFPIPANMPIEGSPGDCAATGDNHAIIFDKKSCVVYEIYHAKSCSTSTPKWSAGSTAIWDLTQNEKRPYGMTSVDAAGLSVFEGLVRYDEVAAGVVNHAIRFTSNWTKNNSNGGFYTAPATHAAGIYGNGVDTIEGMRIRLKANYDISGLSPQAKVIATAMKKYGMILADNGSNLYFTGTSDPRWDDDDLGHLKAIPASAFEVINVPLSSDYTAPSSSFYPNGPVYDAANHPTGNAPVINSFTASSPTIVAGGSSTLSPVISGSSYSYIDNVGFIRGPVTVSPTTTTTYTLTSRNAYGTSTAQVTVTVGNPIASTLQFMSVPDQTYGAPPFVVSATSNSPGAITYSLLNGPASISGNTVSILGIGTVTLQASQAASGNYLAGNATITFNVLAASPMLQLPAVPDQSFGTAPFSISAASNSPGAISYSIVSGPATVSDTTVTLQGVGTVVLQASQVAAGNYLAATTTVSFKVTGVPPTFQLPTVPDQTFGVAPFAVMAMSNSSGAITYSVLSGPAVLAGQTLTLTGIGRVTLQANQAASGNYLAATATTSFNVNAASPDLLLNSIPDQIFGGMPVTVAATSNSSAAITYSVVSGPASITGNTVALSGVGRVALQASQPASGNYLAAAVTTSFNVTAATPTLQIAPVPDQVYGASAFTVSATSNSTGAITYSIVNGPATIAGNAITVNGVGRVTLQAAVPAAGNYLAATATTSFNVTAATPTLQLTAVPTQVYGGAPLAVAASTNSTGAITYSVLSGPATIVGNMLSATGVGLVTVQATVAANGNYLAATATTSFNVTAAIPTLQLATVPDQIYGAAPFAVSASSNSTAAISYSVLSGPAVVNGNAVTVNGVGRVTLQASIPPAGNYLSATATTSFNVTAATPTLQLAAVPDQIYGAAPFAVSASSNSTGAITYSVLSGPAEALGSSIKLNGVGRVTLQATVAANGNYVSATATTSFNVTAATPTLQLAAVPDQVYGAAPFTISASSNSTAAISYSVIGGPATVAGNSVTITGVGRITLQAAMPAAGNYLAAVATTSFNVTPATPILQLVAIPDQVYGSAPVSVSATSNSTGPITYSVLSGPAVISGNIVSSKGVGTVTIQANVEAAGNYLGAATTASFNVTAATPTLQLAAVPDLVYGASPFPLSATSNSTAAISYSVLSGPATIAGNAVMVNGIGRVTLQAAVTAAGNYGPATATTSFNVTAATPTLQISKVPDQVFGAAPFKVSASSNSTGVITYSVLAGPATISGDLITINGAGSVTVQAAVPAAGNYLSATAATSFNVASATPTLQFTAVSDQIFGVLPFPVSATSNSPAAITYSIVSGPGTLNGNLLTLNGLGAITVRASVPAAGSYLSATNTMTFNVLPATPTLRIMNIGPQTVGAPSFSVSAVSDSPAAISWAILSGPANVAGNVLTVTGVGMVTVQASQGATGTYASTAVTTTFAVQDFQLTLSANDMSLVAGESGQLPLHLTSANGFTGTISFTCAVPQSMSDATCSATDAQLSPTSNQVDSILSLKTTKGFSDISENSGFKGLGSKAVVLSLVLPFGLLLKRKRRTWAALALCLISIFTVTGCGVGVAVVGTPRGNYNLTLTAKSGTATHTTTILVTVK